MKNTPIPHDCGRILDINWISKTRVQYNCSVCKELIAWSDIDPKDFSLRVEINISESMVPAQKKKKIYPAPENAHYNPLNIEQWK